MKQHLKILTLTLLAGPTLSAQEFSLFGGGGLSALNYETTVGKQNLGFGGQFGLNYTYFFSENIGVKTGIGFALYNTTFNIENLQTRYTAFDEIENTDFEFRSRLENFQEKQRATMLQIPLMLQYQTFGERQFFVSAGAKIGIPLIGTYKTSIKSIRNSGFYTFENNHYEDFKEVGFHNLTNQNFDGNLDLNVAFFASTEMGMKWQLLSGRAFYVGVFFDYGLNNIVGANNYLPLPVVEFNPLSPKINSVLHSHYNETEQRTFTNGVKPLSAGIMLRFVF